jgi:WD40 repeat protein
MFSKYIFLGNNVGYVRVLDIVRQTEVRPLCDASVRLKVHSLFITEEGSFCVTGHDKGTVCLWDLSTYRLAHKLDAIHHNTIVYCVRVWKETKGLI